MEATQISERSALKIVIVEDSPDLVSSFEEIFSLDGHEVRSFLSGKAALANQDAVAMADVLVTDYYLPDVNGLDVIRGARKINPALPVVLLSGAREPAVLESVRSMPHTLFLSKPINVEDLERGISQVTGKPFGPR